jgi:hypothetical protein
MEEGLPQPRSLLRQEVFIVIETGILALYRRFRRCIRGGKAPCVPAVSHVRRVLLLLLLVVVVVVVQLPVVLPAVLLLLHCPRSCLRLVRELLVRRALAPCTSSPVVPNVC